MLTEQRGVAFDPWVVDTFVAQAASLIELRERINRQTPSFEQLAAVD